MATSICSHGCSRVNPTKFCEAGEARYNVQFSHFNARCGCLNMPRIREDHVLIDIAARHDNLQTSKWSCSEHMEASAAPRYDRSAAPSTKAATHPCSHGL